MDILYWAAFAGTGLAVGFLNTLASSGSAVSLPILMMLGISEVAANATNRLPVLVGALMATFSFAKNRQLDWGAAAKFTPIAVIGSICGALFAEKLGNREMGIAITMAVLIALALLFTKVKHALSLVTAHPPQANLLSLALMFFVGFWLGFLVLDGATYLLLVLMLVCHYALPQANALKSLLIAATTLVPIVMFSGAGDIYWTEGSVMSAGAILGGYLGARLSNHVKAREWVFRLLVLVITLEVLHLAWHYTASLREGI